MNEKLDTKRTAAGLLCGAFSVFVWGITFICTKTLLIDFSPLEILFYRFAAAYLFLWILYPKMDRIPLKDNLFFALAGLSGVVVYQFSENIACNLTSASNVSVIVSICPMFTAIITQIAFKEKHITPFFVLGFVIAITGIALVSLNGSTDVHLSPKGDLLALCSAACWGFYCLFVSILNRKSHNTIGSTRRIFFFAVIFMIPLVLAGMHTKDGSFMHVTFAQEINKIRLFKPLNVIYLLFLGVVASGLCFYTWNKACQIVGTVKISAGIYLIPVVTIIFAFFMLGEKITLMGLLGAALTIAGLFISGLKKKDNTDSWSSSTRGQAD